MEDHKYARAAGLQARDNRKSDERHIFVDILPL